MTLHLEGMELRLAERAIEALETIAEKLTVEPEAPKSMPVPERFSLTENRRFVDGYCEAATIDGGKVTRRCLRGKDHDGECDMRDVCPGTPGMASWKRCEKAKGHVNPCTQDPSADDGHVSPANDDDGLPDRAEATAHVLDCFDDENGSMKRCGSCEHTATHRYKADGSPYAFACDDPKHQVIAYEQARSMVKVVLTLAPRGFNRAGRVEPTW